MIYVRLLRIKCGTCDYTSTRYQRESNGVIYRLPQTFDANELREASQWMLCPKCETGSTLFETEAL